MPREHTRSPLCPAVIHAPTNNHRAARTSNTHAMRAEHGRHVPHAARGYMRPVDGITLMCHTARSSLRRGPGVLSMKAHGGESEGPRHRTGWSAMQGEVARTSRHMTRTPAHITGGAFCTRMPCTLPGVCQLSPKPTRESALRLQPTSCRFGGGGNAASTLPLVGPKGAGGGEWHNTSTRQLDREAGGS